MLQPCGSLSAQDRRMNRYKSKVGQDPVNSLSHSSSRPRLSKQDSCRLLLKRDEPRSARGGCWQPTYIAFFIIVLRHPPTTAMRTLGPCFATCFACSSRSLVGRNEARITKPCYVASSEPERAVIMQKRKRARLSSELPSAAPTKVA